jgi:hypothetical protein
MFKRFDMKNSIKYIFSLLFLFLLIGCKQDYSTAQNGASNSINEMQEGDISLECTGKIKEYQDEIKINIIYSPRFPEISKIYNQLASNDNRRDNLPWDNLILREYNLDDYLFDIKGGLSTFYVLRLNRKDLSARLVRNTPGVSSTYSEYMLFKCIKSNENYFKDKLVENAEKIKISNKLNKI